MGAGAPVVAGLRLARRACYTSTLRSPRQGRMRTPKPRNMRDDTMLGGSDRLPVTMNRAAWRARVFGRTRIVTDRLVAHLSATQRPRQPIMGGSPSRRRARVDARQAPNMRDHAMPAAMFGRRNDAIEYWLGNESEDISTQKIGYDITSYDATLCRRRPRRARTAFRADCRPEFNMKNLLGRAEASQ